jgi:radical SAM protein with 4Fe4S-binding SPASM domain
MTAQIYKKMCGADIDFEKFVENIRYFHDRRTVTSIYIKIIDAALTQEHDEAEFHRIFDPICDVADIEFVCPITNEIDYLKYGIEFKGTMRRFGDLSGSKACPIAFYMLALHPDGSVAPWCASNVSVIYGNVQEKSIPEIWKSQAVRDFQILQLTDKTANPVCRSCTASLYNVRNGDSLNGHESEILSRFH